MEDGYATNAEEIDKQQMDVIGMAETVEPNRVNAIGKNNGKNEKEGTVYITETTKQNPLKGDLTDRLKHLNQWDWKDFKWGGCDEDWSGDGD